MDILCERLGCSFKRVLCLQERRLRGGRFIASVSQSRESRRLLSAQWRKQEPSLKSYIVEFIRGGMSQPCEWAVGQFAGTSSTWAGKIRFESRI